MDAAHVQLDDTTLDAAYTSVRQIVTDNSSRTSTLETEMEVVQGQIDQRIWKTDIKDATDPLGTQITQISDRYATQQQTIAWALLRGRLFCVRMLVLFIPGMLYLVNQRICVRNNQWKQLFKSIMKL